MSNEKEIIRIMKAEDGKIVADMMRVFYASPAVLSNGSDEIFKRDIEACLGDNPYAEGYVFEMAGVVVGYGMIAKSFSTEFGKPCVWIEDIYVMEEYRGRGIGSEFIQFVMENNPNCVIRLEVEEDNKRAIDVYHKNGFSVLPYMEMKI